MSDTTIAVPESLRDELYSRKGSGTSYAEYIEELLEKADRFKQIQAEEGTNTQSADTLTKNEQE